MKCSDADTSTIETATSTAGGHGACWILQLWYSSPVSSDLPMNLPIPPQGNSAIFETPGACGGIAQVNGAPFGGPNDGGDAD